MQKLAAVIAAVPALVAAYLPRWLAIQLLEGDELLRAAIAREPAATAVVAALAGCGARLEQIYGDDVNVALVNSRYEFVHQVVQESVTHHGARHVTLSDKIDRAVTHPLLGIPIFLFAMWVVFKLTIDVSAPMMGWIEGVIAGPITNWVVLLLTAGGLGGSWVESLVVDGVLAGVGGVLVFVPIMLVLYMALAVLDDCGYMARGALVMDRLMRKFGLHGKSFVPLIVGFGCSVPAIYATRTLENRRDRILTGLLVPFMSCSARLPVYVLIAAIFFPFAASLAIFAMYLLGIVVAVVVGLVLSRTVLKGDGQSYLLIELPPYRLPVARNIWRQMWERTASFLRNAWTTILVVSVVLWLLLAIPMPGATGSFAATPVDESVFGATAGAVAPLLAPLGFGTWQASGSLITGFVAKEVIVATMAQVYHVAPIETESAPPPTVLEDAVFVLTSFVQAMIDTVRAIPQIIGINLTPTAATEEPGALMVAVRAGFEESSGGHGALAGLAFMVFVLLYTPCMMAITAEKHEFGARWMWASILGQLVIAWLVAIAVFQVGKLLLG
ncbi:MAG: ferrous iron transport protein B [Anaerolineales bacterium]|nr:ferrous iron transport protein B [Anaerolineales bacterium]